MGEELDLSQRIPENADLFSQSDFSIDAKEITDLKKIGEGAYGAVFCGMYRGEKVAMKSQPIEGSVENLDVFLATEICVLKSLRHENLLTYVGAGLLEAKKGSLSPKKQKPRMIIVTEFMELGDLRRLWRKRLQAKKPLSWPNIIRFLADAATGLNYLHCNHILHRDIKTENLLVDRNLTCKLCDFGFARKQASMNNNQRVRMTICGTDEFMAPEVIFEEPYDACADVFSFGIIIAELLCRQIPNGKRSDGFLHRGPRNKFNIDQDTLRKKFIAGSPTGLQELCTECIHFESDERAESDDLLEWLQELRECLNTDDEEPTPEFETVETEAAPKPAPEEVLDEHDDEDDKDDDDLDEDEDLQDKVEGYDDDDDDDDDDDIGWTHREDEEEEEDEDEDEDEDDKDESDKDEGEGDKDEDEDDKDEDDKGEDDNDAGKGASSSHASDDKVSAVAATAAATATEDSPDPTEDFPDMDDPPPPPPPYEEEDTPPPPPTPPPAFRKRRLSFHRRTSMTIDVAELATAAASPPAYEDFPSPPASPDPRSSPAVWSVREERNVDYEYPPAAQRAIENAYQKQRPFVDITVSRGGTDTKYRIQLEYLNTKFIQVNMETGYERLVKRRAGRQRAVSKLHGMAPPVPTFNKGMPPPGMPPPPMPNFERVLEPPARPLSTRPRPPSRGHMRAGSASEKDVLSFVRSVVQSRVKSPRQRSIKDVVAAAVVNKYGPSKWVQMQKLILKQLPASASSPGVVHGGGSPRMFRSPRKSAGEFDNDLRGMLFKRSVWAKKWKQRYFVINNTSLEFYSRKEDWDRRQAPRGSIALLGATIEAEKEPRIRRKSSFKKGAKKGNNPQFYAIVVKPRKGKHKTRGVQLAAACAADQRSWTRVLKAHTKRQTSVTRRTNLTRLERLVTESAPGASLPRSRIVCDLLIDEGRYKVLIDTLNNNVLTPLRETIAHLRKHNPKKNRRRRAIFKPKKVSAFQPLDIPGLTHKGYSIGQMKFSARQIEGALPLPGLMKSMFVLHKSIFNAIRQKAREWKETTAIGAALSKIAPYFRMYLGFCDAICNLTFHLASAAVTVAMTGSPEFVDILTFLNGEEHNDGLAEGSNMAVERMLLAPLCRLPYYARVLQRLRDVTPAGHPDIAALDRTLAVFRDLVKPLDNAYARARNACELYRVQAQFRFYDDQKMTQKMVESGSQFVMRDTVDCVVVESNGVKGKRSPKHLVVLSNMVMVCDTIKNIDARGSMLGTSLFPMWTSDLTALDGADQSYRVAAGAKSLMVTHANGTVFKLFDLTPAQMTKISNALRDVMRSL